MSEPKQHWDVVVVGGGPAGLSAAHAAAAGGARTLVLEKAVHPRYKTCGGGLIGFTLQAVADRIDIPADDHITRVDFTHDGRRAFARSGRRGRPLLLMVRRPQFDDALRVAAEKAGAVVRQSVTARSLEQTGDAVVVRLADGETVTGRTVIGADGSSGITARHAGVEYGQVDLGLEVELPVPAGVAARWKGRLLIDWGPLPGSYAWVFPKDDVLTVGVIAARGQGERTKRYLRDFVTRLGLDGIEPVHDSGHLTRCRTATSPLRTGRVLVAGDAAGLLEPWTREGISFAVRSGSLAGAAAASGDLDGYVTAVQRTLVPAMTAGRRLLDTFSRRPGLFHAMLRTPPGWRMFERFCLGETSFEHTVERLPVRTALKLLQ
ncbi:geranylgeranyl reductase family protein [Dactylosporangium siamense]|uniref:Hyaluronate lyase n=1 Tax=Dactylosporangium siamense TaxID=685454 RepID=A0A919PZ22_9ACTN|nr:geranylgeranyl reductase family protein [Dactylosporangium siamense]GIG51183.1 hyaluronate lyase [Dactylosporangium siamense]